MKTVASWVIVGVLLVGGGVWWASAATPQTHAQANDGADAILHLHDYVDLAVLQSFLTYAETASYIQDTLTESEASDVTLQWRAGTSLSDREYYFTMRFPEPGLLTDSLLTVSYTHDGSSGGEPALTPDSCTYEFVQGLPRTKPGATVLSDNAGYDFLVHVLTQERRVIWKVARGETITGLKIEENERPAGRPEYLVHLKVSRGRSIRVVTLGSELNKRGEFGRLMIRRDQ